MQIRPIKTAVGIDIGASQVKIVQTSGGLARRVIPAPLMRGLIHDSRTVSKHALAATLTRTTSKVEGGVTTAIQEVTKKYADGSEHI